MLAWISLVGGLRWGGGGTQWDSRQRNVWEKLRFQLVTGEINYPAQMTATQMKKETESAREGPGTSLGEGNGTPLQYSCLENPMDGRAWWAAVHGVAKSRGRLSDFTFTFHFHALEKEMAPHSNVLAWRIPGTVEPGGLPSMGSHRVGHD